MNPKDLVKKYIEMGQVLQLATVKNNQPAVCNLHYAFDEISNLYWMSLRSTKHSENLRNNKRTAVSILHDPNNKQCVHIEGEAYELTGEEAAKAHEIYGDRFGQKEQRLTEAQSDNPMLRTYYVFLPKVIMLFDEENFPDNSPQKVSI